ncbi:hypothetical protein J6R97_00130 [bacterium]|nr:hypothetical protein [bacterium]
MDIQIQSALIGGGLALLGVVVTLIFNYIQERQRFDNNIKLQNKAKSENAYLELLEYITHISANKVLMIKKQSFPDEERAKYNGVLVKCKLYATEKIANDFYQFMDTVITDINNGKYTDTEEMYEGLFTGVRKELNIKE